MKKRALFVLYCYLAIMAGIAGAWVLASAWPLLVVLVALAAVATGGGGRRR